jgi:hypothetical protein
MIIIPGEQGARRKHLFRASFACDCNNRIAGAHPGFILRNHVMKWTTKFAPRIAEPEVCNARALYFPSINSPLRGEPLLYRPPHRLFPALLMAPR